MVLPKLQGTNPAAKQYSTSPEEIPLPVWNGENDHTIPYLRDAHIFNKKAERCKSVRLFLVFIN